jgi:kexin
LSYHAVDAFKHSFDTHDYYVLQHDPHVGPSLSQVAARLGVQVVERAGELNNIWVVRTPKQLTSTSRDKRDRTDDPVFATLAGLRNPRSARDPDRLVARSIADSVKHLSRQELRQRVKRAPPPVLPGQHDDDPSAHPLAQAVSERLAIHDPQFIKQWHIVNDEFPEHSMNVTRLWEMGITGAGIVTALVDDGLDYESEDLADNFVSVVASSHPSPPFFFFLFFFSSSRCASSYVVPPLRVQWAPGSHDYNDHEDLPTPKLPDDHHGTRCAGQIGAVKNNVCGVGIAYDSKVAGVRILSGPISDIDEAAALNFHYHNTSIYSCSWGPPDDGKSMESPSYLIERAILNGIQRGRGGKGSIFVFASGNGAAFGDQCNFDGYTNSIYSVTIPAIDFKGLHPVYSEACAANLVVAYSSGSGNHIVRRYPLTQPPIALFDRLERSPRIKASLYVPSHTVGLLQLRPMLPGCLLSHFLFGRFRGRTPMSPYY